MTGTTIPQVVITDYQFPNVDRERNVIEEAGYKLQSFQCRSEADVIELAGGADALLVQYAPISAAVIARLTNCRVIVRYGIGVDNIDVDAARGRGIDVCNVPDYCIDEVADHTLAMALALVRQLPAMDETLRGGTWEAAPPESMLALRQMTFATIGCGRTAVAVLDRARGFKFRLATYDPYLCKGEMFAEDVKVLSLDRVLETADIISLHVPLNRETRHMIDARALAKMKQRAILINTARGGLVDGTALASALRARQLGGAGLDVFEPEPLEANHPLRECKNAILTPHIAWYSALSCNTLQTMAAEEAVRGLAGQQLRSKIN